MFRLRLNPLCWQLLSLEPVIKSWEWLLDTLIGTTERLRWILPLRDLEACSEGNVLEAFTFGSSVLESDLYSMSSHNLNYSQRY
jgi:hypothetical protein